MKPRNEKKNAENVNEDSMNQPIMQPDDPSPIQSDEDIESKKLIAIENLRVLCEEYLNKLTAEAKAGGDETYGAAKKQAIVAPLLNILKDTRTTSDDKLKELATQLGKNTVFDENKSNAEFLATSRAGWGKTIVKGMIAILATVTVIPMVLQAVYRAFAQKGEWIPAQSLFAVQGDKFVTQARDTIKNNTLEADTPKNQGSKKS